MEMVIKEKVLNIWKNKVYCRKISMWREMTLSILSIYIFKNPIQRLLSKLSNHRIRELTFYGWWLVKIRRSEIVCVAGGGERTILSMDVMRSRVPQRISQSLVLKLSWLHDYIMSWPTLWMIKLFMIVKFKSYCEELQHYLFKQDE